MTVILYLKNGTLVAFKAVDRIYRGAASGWGSNDLVIETSDKAQHVIKFYDYAKLEVFP